MNISSTGSHHRPDPAEFFKKADADSSGGISKDEFKTMMENGPRKTSGAADAKAPDFDAMFAETDTDGDGQISSAENEAAMQAHHSRGGNSAGGMNGSSGMLGSIMDTLKQQDDGQEVTLSDDQRKALEQLIAEMRGGQNLYNSQGTAESANSSDACNSDGTVSLFDTTA